MGAACKIFDRGRKAWLPGHFSSVGEGSRPSCPPQKLLSRFVLPVLLVPCIKARLLSLLFASGSVIAAEPSKPNILLIILRRIMGPRAGCGKARRIFRS